MLDLAEDARRYNQASRAILDLSARDGAGSNGPIGHDRARAAMASPFAANAVTAPA